MPVAPVGTQCLGGGWERPQGCGSRAVSPTCRPDCCRECYAMSFFSFATSLAVDTTPGLFLGLSDQGLGGWQTHQGHCHQEACGQPGQDARRWRLWVGPALCPTPTAPSSWISQLICSYPVGISAWAGLLIPRGDVGAGQSTPMPTDRTGENLLL